VPFEVEEESKLALAPHPLLAATVARNHQKVVGPPDWAKLPSPCSTVFLDLGLVQQKG
jgi:hypothetical protein